MRKLALFALVAAPAVAVPPPGRTMLPAVPAGYVETVLATGLNRPVALAWLSGSRLLIAEQYTGNILMYKNGAMQPAPYAVVSPVSASTNETGLVGMCTDASDNVYVFVTATSTAQRVIRYTTVGDTGTSPTILVDSIPTMDTYHNGGGIGIGPDGFLYVCVGDNGPQFGTGDDLDGAANGLHPNPQNPTSWRGKVLRFTTGGAPAPGNPWGGAVYSRGHRNPFRFTWRPSNGGMYLTENGPSVDDEINRVAAGAHYGWPYYTGNNNTTSPPGYIAPVEGPVTVPIAAFTPTIAITDLLFYTGATMPEFADQMFFVDYKNGRIQRYTLDANDAILSGPTDFVTGVNQVVDLEQGPDGAIYYCSLLGSLRRAQSAGAGNLAPTASFTRTPASGAPGVTVGADASGSYDTDGSIASYAWNWGDGSPAGSGATASHAYANAGSYTITLTVTDNQGATSQATQGVLVSSGNLPPSAHIEGFTPTTGTAPVAVTFEGHAHDDAHGLAHTWDFGDGSPLVTLGGRNADQNSTVAHTFAGAGTFVVTLTVTDAGGLTASHTETITIAAGASGGGEPDGSGSGGGGGGCGCVGLEAILLLALLRRKGGRK